MLIFLSLSLVRSLRKWGECILVWTRTLNSRRRRRRRRPRRREKASPIVSIVLREGFGTCDLEGVGGRRI
jgi:hypothetical protein